MALGGAERGALAPGALGRCAELAEATSERELRTRSTILSVCARAAAATERLSFAISLGWGRGPFCATERANAARLCPLPALGGGGAELDAEGLEASGLADAPRGVAVALVPTPTESDAAGALTRDAVLFPTSMVLVAEGGASWRLAVAGAMALSAAASC